MTCNLHSGDSCWTKASNQRTDPGTGTEVGLGPPMALWGSQAPLAEVEIVLWGLPFTLSLEYSLFPYGKLQAKHYSSSYQAIYHPWGPISWDTWAYRQMLPVRMADDPYGFLKVSSGVLWMFSDSLYFLWSFWLLWLWWKAGNVNVDVLNVSY